MSVGRREAVILSEILTEVAASEIVPRFRRLSEGAIRCKSGPLDLVTEADEIAELAIVERLARAFPGAVVIGEEAASRDRDVIRRLQGAPLAIVVDPIDGTANFAAGVPLFGSMAAIVVEGEVVAAAIHDPLGGDTAIAARGDGSEILFKDGGTQTLRVARAGTPSPSIRRADFTSPRQRSTATTWWWCSAGTCPTAISPSWQPTVSPISSARPLRWTLPPCWMCWAASWPFAGCCSRGAPLPMAPSSPQAWSMNSASS